MRYCGHFLIKAEGGAKNYERDHPLPLAWRPFTVVFVHRKGYVYVIARVGVKFGINFTSVRLNGNKIARGEAECYSSLNLTRVNFVPGNTTTNRTIKD